MKGENRGVLHNPNEIIGVPVMDVLRVLDAHYELKSINFSGKDLSSLDIKLLCEAIATNKTIEELNFSNNKIEYKAMQYIGKMLESNSTLQTLRIRGNFYFTAAYEDASIPTESMVGIQALTDGMVKNTQLKCLDLGHNAINDEAARLISNALKNHPSIKILNLEFNMLSDTGAGYLLSLIEANSRIIELNISSSMSSISTGLATQILEKMEENRMMSPYQICCEKLREGGLLSELGNEIVYNAYLIIKNKKLRCEERHQIIHYLVETAIACSTSSSKVDLSPLPSEIQEQIGLFVLEGVVKEFNKGRAKEA